MKSNIGEILKLFKTYQEELNNLKLWLTQWWIQRDILDIFITYLDLNPNEATRYIAYSRLSDLKEDALLEYIEKNNIWREQGLELLKKAYKYVQIFYSDRYQTILQEIEEKKYTSEFYNIILQSNWLIGQEMCKWQLAWKEYIIDTLNYNLEKKLNHNTQDILNYLSQNEFFELDIKWRIADRSYSTLVLRDWVYKKVSYIEAFPFEISSIIAQIEITIEKLEKQEDKEYNKKQEYIDYFIALKNALWETDTNRLIEKWSQVDIEWMKIDTPFQIGHPLEFYEDLYRKSVAPEWDMRIVDDQIMQSTIQGDITNMYEKLYDEIGRDKYASSYQYSLQNQKKVQLYISNPSMVFWAELSWMFSAQVVPNDDRVSALYGKKIFAYPEFILSSQRNAPKLALTQKMFSQYILVSYDSILADDKKYYQIYDIETIGHEFWHTLWLDIGVESIMNQTWNFKNIEEFKATAWGLCAYFMSKKNDIDDEIFITHIMRSLRMMKYRLIEDVICYYTECLIHLEIMYAAWVISVENNVLEFHREYITSAKNTYIFEYKKLIDIYLEKKDAGEFLYQFVTQEGKVFLPKQPKLRKFVEYYYSEYKKIGNTLADQDSYII